MASPAAEKFAASHNAGVKAQAATPGVGHNNPPANEKLKSFVDRLENLEQEKKSFADDIRDVYAEAKSNGLDTKALRTIIKMRKQDADKRAEQQAIVDTYAHALGMLL